MGWVSYERQLPHRLQPRRATQEPWGIRGDVSNRVKPAEDALVLATGLPNRGLKKEADSQHSRLAVLDFVPPACLMEIGFIDNDHDRQIMQDLDVRIKFWQALARSIG